MFLDLPDPKTCIVVLVDPEDSRRDLFRSLLLDRSLTVCGAHPTVERAMTDLSGLDLAIIHVGFASKDEIAGLRNLRACCSAPILALTEHPDPSVVDNLLSSGADEVAPVGVKADRIAFGAAAAMASRSKFEATERARDRAEAALQDHKLVMRAKGILMTRQDLNEAEAHRRIQGLSMARNIPMAEMARQILDAEALLT